MQRLRAAKNGGQCLVSGAHDIIIGLLGGEGRTGGLRVEAQHHRARVPGMETIAHNVRPHAACRAKLGDLLKEVVMTIKKEGELTRERVDVETSVDGCLYVADGVGEGKSDLLRGS